MYFVVLVYRLLNPLGFVRPRPDQLAVFQGGPSRTGGSEGASRTIFLLPLFGSLAAGIKWCGMRPPIASPLGPPANKEKNGVARRPSFLKIESMRLRSSKHHILGSVCAIRHIYCVSCAIFACVISGSELYFLGANTCLRWCEVCAAGGGI